MRSHTFRELERLLTATVNSLPKTKFPSLQKKRLQTDTVHQVYYSSCLRSTEEIKQQLSKKAVTARPLLGGMTEGPLAFFFFTLFTAKGKRTLFE